MAFLQLDAMTREAFGTLARATDATTAIADVRQARRAIARTGPLAGRLAVALDDALWTETLEYIDTPGFPEDRKLAIARGLDLLNRATGAYGRFYRLLAPTLRAVVAREGRPARVLEIACGVGGFSRALARHAHKDGLPVAIVGSDIVPSYVAHATAHHAAANVSFIELDALAASGIADGHFDVVFLAQSTHHFSPSQLAGMIAEARRIATSEFVAVDGYRSLRMLCFVVATALLSGRRDAVHDALTSARKFYSAIELELIARIASETSRITTQRLFPLETALRVSFDGAR